MAFVINALLAIEIPIQRSNSRTIVNSQPAEISCASVCFDLFTSIAACLSICYYNYNLSLHPDQHEQLQPPAHTLIPCLALLKQSHPLTISGWFQNPKIRIAGGSLPSSTTTTSTRSLSNQLHTYVHYHIGCVGLYGRRRRQLSTTRMYYVPDEIFIMCGGGESFCVPTTSPG